MPTYANIDRINRKLNGRLKIEADEFYPMEEVDENLINDAIEEREAFVDLILSQVYEMPLRNTHLVVQNIVENLVMADLIDYNYISSPSTGNSLEAFSTQCKQKAFNVLYQLINGTGIVIPGADGGGYYSMMQNKTRLELKGEIPNSAPPSLQTVNNYTYVGNITNEQSNAKTYLIDDKQTNNPFSMDFLMGN